MNQDTTQTILQSAGRFFSGTMLSRVTGLLRDMAMAYAFGVNAQVAALMLAFRLSHLFRRVLGEGALQTAFTPLFEELRVESPARAFAFFRALRVGVTGILLLLCLLMMGGGGSALTFLSLSPDNQDVLSLTLWMMPGLIFICLFGMNAALLQCEKSFFTSSVAPVAFNLIWIVGVWICKDWPLHQAMVGMALAVNGACLAQWLMTVPKTGSLLAPFSWGGWQDVKRMLPPFLLAVTGVAATQVNSTFDALFARYADPEGPALLWYAIRIQQLPLAVFGIALSSAILPPLSRAMKQGDQTAFHTFLQFGIRKTIWLMLPLTLGMILFAKPGVALLYGHGDFNAAAITGTTLCLWGYAVGLLPTALVLVLAPAYYAQNNYRLPMQASILSMVSNTCLNILFIGVFGLGAASVAFATSVSAWLNLALLWRHQEFGKAELQP